MRKELVHKEKQRREGEEARRLAAEATEIARFINEDFDAFRDRVSKTRARAPGLVDPVVGASDLAGPAEDMSIGTEVPASVTDGHGGPGAEGGDGASGGNPRLLMPQVKPDPDGDRKGRAANTGAKPRHKRGGFGVEFQAMGKEERRATYAPDERTIYINLEHPQIVAARGSGDTEQPTFRRLAYEVAFTEYAIALSSELAQRGEYLDPSDPIYEIRETVNRLARRGAALYSS
jgi:hypothetical protein